eukprot:COSAG01_NODE_47307_length_391_cov_3.311644_1_plen_58_part_10
MRPHLSYRRKLDHNGVRHRGKDGQTFGEIAAHAVISNLRPQHHAPRATSRGRGGRSSS